MLTIVIILSKICLHVCSIKQRGENITLSPSHEKIRQADNNYKLPTENNFIEVG